MDQGSWSKIMLLAGATLVLLGIGFYLTGNNTIGLISVCIGVAVSLIGFKVLRVYLRIRSMRK
ncbi:MAG: hypothetical protein LBE47_03005 [Methanomassiliicoccaceae archaeon]|jgi:hypothetical protein|nr:hypothetical protein [Methanomassiliicoccaceae archaeon]